MNQIGRSNPNSERRFNNKKKVNNVATISDHNNATESFRKFPRVKSDENASLTSITSNETIDYNSGIGFDHKGRRVNIGDLVEVLSGSKNGIPFKPNDKAFVMGASCNRIKLRKQDNENIIGWRDRKNISLID